jgi:hypothetical protein
MEVEDGELELPLKRNVALWNSVSLNLVAGFS